MATIDERIVSLKFNTANFQAGMRETLGSLNKLDSALAMDRAKSGLSGLSSAVKSVDTTHLANGVEQVTSRFSMLQGVATVALGNIAAQMAQTAASFSNQFLFGPIIQGFQEYETKMNAVQTIMANVGHKGKSLQDVNNVLSQLNDYADKTVYNFAEMTSNIGKFTAAGISLEDSVSSIKGLSNVAAMAGSNTVQLNTAMYQMSQALQQGQIKLMDWKSLENAGMATEAFKESIKETARVFGVSVDDIIAEKGSFNASLSEGWLTAEIFTQTLAKFTGDLNDEQLRSLGYTEEQIVKIQEMAKTANDAATKVKTFTQLIDTTMEALGSGWAQTWEIIFGDFEAAKGMFTGISDRLNAFIGQTSDARNALLQGWKDLGGREAALKGFYNLVELIAKPIRAIGEAFMEVFGGPTANQLYSITTAIRDFLLYITLSDKMAALLKNTFKLLFTGIKIGIDTVVNFAKVLGTLLKGAIDNAVKAFGNSGQQVQNFIKHIVDSAKRFGEFVQSSEWVQRAIAQLQPVFDQVGVAIGRAMAYFARLGDAFRKALPPEKLNQTYDKIRQSMDKLREAFSKVIPPNAGQIFDQVGQQVAGFAKAFEDAVVNVGATGLGQVLSDLLDILGDLATGSIDVVTGLLAGFTGELENAKAAANPVAQILHKVGEAFRGFIDMVKQGVDRVMPQLRPAIEKAFGGLREMSGQIDWAGLLPSALIAGPLVFVGKAVMDLGRIIGNFFKAFSDTTAALGDVLESVGDAIDAFSAKVQAEALLTIAIAVGVLAGALLLLSAVPAERLAPNLAVLGTSMAGLVLAMKTLDGLDTEWSSGVMILTLIGLGTALLLMAGAAKKLGQIDTGSLIKGTTAVVALTAAMTGAAYGLGKVDKGQILAAGLTLVALSVSMHLTAGAIKKIGEIELGVLFKGVTVMGVILTIVTLYNRFSNEKVSVGNALSLMAIAGAMLKLGDAIEHVGSMDLGTVLQGVITLGLIIAALVAALNFVPKDAIAKAVLLVAFAASVALIGHSIGVLGAIPFGAALQGVISLAVIMGILVVAVNLLRGKEGSAGALIAIAAAINLLVGPLMLLSTLPLAGLGIALVALAGALGIMVAAAWLVSPVVVPLMALGGAIGLIGIGIGAAAAGVAMFATALVGLAGVGVAGMAAIATGARMLIDLIPHMATKMAEGMTNFILAISSRTGEIIGAFVQIGHGILDAIVQLVPRMIEVGVTIITSFLDGIIQVAPKVGETLMVMITTGLAVLRSAVPQFIETGWTIIMAFLDGIAQNIGGVIQKASEIIQAFLRGIGQEAPRVLEAGADMIIDFMNGVANTIRNKRGEIVAAAQNIGSAILEGISGGISGGWGWLMDQVGSLASGMLQNAKNVLGIKSPSRRFREIGKFTMEGWQQGIAWNKGMVLKEMSAVTKAVIDEGDNLDMPSFDPFSVVDDQPKITPVMDLSLIKRQAGDIPKILGNTSLGLAKALSTDLAPKAPQPSREEYDPVTGGRGTTVNFTQNNYSPEALSDFEIYRQTRNQLEQFKEALG